MVAGAPSLNPSGRPRGAAGIARYIGEQTKDGEELVDRLLVLSRSDKSVREAAAATMALLDRYAGRAMQPSEIALSGSLTASAPQRDFSSMPIDERRALLESIRKVPVMGQQPTGSADDDASNATAPYPSRAPERAP